MELKVKDILHRPHFENAEVITGKKGLDKTINWVHVVEINKFGHLLHGQEMILTTGISWVHDRTKSLDYLEQLIDNNASVLCIELTGDKKDLPNEMLELAEEHHFPIILFHKEVKFIDITKDIHKLLLNYQENIWLDLENLYKTMHQNLVSNGPIEEFIRILHQGTRKQIALIQHQEQEWFFPTPSAKQRIQWLQEIEIHAYFSIPIYFLNDVIATLYIIEDVEQITVFDQFAANRCSEFLTQYFWKFYQQIEIQQAKKNEWLTEAIAGNLSRDNILDSIHQIVPQAKADNMIIGVVPQNNQVLTKRANDSFLTGTLMTIRSIFENHGFYLIATRMREHHCYVLLLLNQLEPTTLYKRITKSQQLFKQANSMIFSQDLMKWISFGKVIQNPEHIPQSFQTAMSTLKYQEDIASLEEPFYYQLTTYRLIDQMKNRKELDSIINDYLGPLLQYDKNKGTELLKTLQIYFKNFGAKNETAKDLFIVRQTLYHRLDKIEEILGEDYLEQHKRVMIEFAMYALDYLAKTK